MRYSKIIFTTLDVNRANGGNSASVVDKCMLFDALLDQMSLGLESLLSERRFSVHLSVINTNILLLFSSSKWRTSSVQWYMVQGERFYLLKLLWSLLQ